MDELANGLSTMESLKTNHPSDFISTCRKKVCIECKVHLKDELLN